MLSFSFSILYLFSNSPQPSQFAMESQNTNKRFSATGGAAEVWRKMIALGMRPGMINMGQGFPDFQV